MAIGQLNTVVHYLRHITAARPDGAATDAALLERFVSYQDEVAFELLVRRHGPMVLGLCQRVLHDAHDAEDAFQATFLVLVRKAALIRKQTAVSSWLYGVAYRTAVKVRTDCASRRAHERQVATMPASESSPEPTWSEVRCILDQELDRLPDKYRAPVVLCYLQGLTYEEAARQLGCPKGTVAIRLSRARERLRASLVRRGVTLSAGLLAAALCPQSSTAAVPIHLLGATVRAGLLVAAGKTTLTGVVSTRVVALTQGVMETMPMTKLKLTLALVLALAIVTAGPGLLLRQALVAKPPAAQTKPPAAQAKGTAADQKPAAGAKVSRPDPDTLARRAWATMDLVLKDHMEPCPRQTMIQTGITAFLKAAQVKPPADLASRSAALTTQGQLAAFLREVWPSATGQPGIESTKLEEALLQGLLEKVPGKPNLLPPIVFNVFEQVSGNRYVGTGIQIKMDDKEKLPQIIVPFRRGPARKAGAIAGDFIVEVDGKSTVGTKLVTVVEWLRGPEGSAVTMVVRQPGAKETRTLHMIRSVVPFDTVQGLSPIAEDEWSYRADPSAPIAYVRVESIRSSTLHELQQLERRLRDEGFRALVLDFRSTNGEGVVQHAALLADGLLDGGLMWGVRDAQERLTEYRADRECWFRNWPIVALQNGDIIDNAQAAVLAALQDNGRAVLVGEPTRNDGYVNRLFPLPEGLGGVALRIGRMERAAKGRGWPVQPDVLVPLNKTQQEALRKWFGLKDGMRLLAGEKDRPGDPQLAKALELLRAALKTGALPGKGA
jgi:C-terminal peptidase prc